VDEDRVFDLLMDIKDSKLRFNQVDYLITTFQIEDGLGSPVWDKIGTSYDVGDPVGNGVSSALTRLAELKEERELLAKKIAMYETWVSFLGDDELLAIINHLFIERRSAASYYDVICPMGKTSFYRKQAKIMEVLKLHPIFAITEAEKVRR